MRELLLQSINPREIGGHIVVTATLVGEEPEPSSGVLVARSRSAEVDDGREVLLFLKRRRRSPPVAHRAGDVTVEQRRGHLYRMTRNHARIEAIEPAGL